MSNKQRTAASLLAAALTASSAVALAPAAEAAPAAQTGGAACGYQQPTYLPVGQGVTSGTVTATAGKDVYAGTVEVPNGSSSTKRHAALWTDGNYTDLGTVANAEDGLWVKGANSSGTVVGGAMKVTGSSDGWPLTENYPFRSHDGKLERLPVPAGAHDVIATTVTAQGDVYGYGYGIDDNNYTKVYMWPADKPGTVVEPIGFPRGSKVAGVDADGTVAVTAVSNPEGTWRPYVWKDGVAKALQLPSGAPNGSISAISNGRVVGQGLTANFGAFAVLWDKDGEVKKLPGGTGTTAINADGLIVGSGKTNLWQLAQAKPALTGSGSLNAVSADSTIVGSAPTADSNSFNLPAIWRCS
ncbi:hypothetical protein ACIODT_39130 [Streptomyces sp. NPDC088251]|uniref:hypothetical protein n=1 Tax=unclassified Streptomyces TaxID=2593676 RepID=UPI00380504F8